ncbi:MAG TPA: terminase family protein [Bryobacteraceae bacterium]|nr:terminase family protein [Bryobacteraceae bacterium]
MSPGEASWAFDPAHFAETKLGFKPDAKQRTVLESGARRLILCCSRQWGKSTVSAVAALHEAIYRPGSQIVVLSRSLRQSGELVRKVRGFAGKLGLRLKGDGVNQVSLQFPNGSRVVGTPSTGDTIRGFSAVTLMLVDEASRVTDELYHAVRPMLATTDGRLWLMSTPNGKDGFFYREWAYGGDTWLRVEARATECERLSERFLEEEKETLGEKMFGQEYLCRFVQSQDRFFDEDDIRACLREDLEPLRIPGWTV